MANTIESLSVELRVPEDLFLIRKSAALAANAGLPEETLIVTPQDDPASPEAIPSCVIISGTSKQIAVFEEILTDAARASRKIEQSTGTSRSAYEASMHDHFAQQGVRRGLRQAA